MVSSSVKGCTPFMAAPFMAFMPKWQLIADAVFQSNPSGARPRRGVLVRSSVYRSGGKKKTETNPAHAQARALSFARGKIPGKNKHMCRLQVAATWTSFHLRTAEKRHQPVATLTV